MSLDPFDVPIDADDEADRPWVAPEPDPFDTPAFDPATGELLEDSVIEGIAAQTVVPTDADSLAAHASQAIALAPQLSKFTGELRRDLEQRIGSTYSELVARRPEGTVTAEVAAPELTWLADAHEVMAAIGEVFTAQAKGLRELAGDVVREVRTDKPIEKTGGAVSVKVGARRPGDAVKVTATQPTEVFTETAQIVDVLVPHLLDTCGIEYAEPGEGTAAFADGARAMAAALLGLNGQVGLLASPSWKTTALDVLRNTLQAGGEVGVGLAARLQRAYGRRPKGNVQTKIERTQLREERQV